VAGLDSLEAGIWSQVLLVGGLLGWVATYAYRAMGKNMTYHQQRKDYEEAYLQKRLDELTPEELAKLQAEIEEERTQV
jgi:DNA-binding IclR family transcriptional regulator